MRTLLLLISAVAASSSRRCVNDVDWVQCTCMDDDGSELITTLSDFQNGKWKSSVHVDSEECDVSEAKLWLSLITGDGRPSGRQSPPIVPVRPSPRRFSDAEMTRKGYERHGDSMYKFHPVSDTWENARRTCVREGAHLAIINSAQEAHFLQELFRRYPRIQNVLYNDFAFIGFHDIYTEAEYITIFGVPIDRTGYSVWWGGRPDNAGRNLAGNPGEDCGSMHRKGGLNDLPCDWKHAFICEIEDSPDPVPGGIDYSDGTYVGVESVVKPAAGTKPRKTAGEGYEFFPGIGFYRFHTDSDVWENARRTCEREGAHLAIINSEGEAQVLKQLYARNNALQNVLWNDFAFIGFHDQYNEGEFLTVYTWNTASGVTRKEKALHVYQEEVAKKHQQRLNYKSLLGFHPDEPLYSTGFTRWWASFEPNDLGHSNINSGEDCGAIHRNGGYDDLPCNKRHAFFCEKELYE